MPMDRSESKRVLEESNALAWMRWALGLSDQAFLTLRPRFLDQESRRRRTGRRRACIRRAGRRG